jgi:hypothetical protein
MRLPSVRYGGDTFTRGWCVLISTFSFQLGKQCHHGGAAKVVGRSNHFGVNKASRALRARCHVQQ